MRTAATLAGAAVAAALLVVSPTNPTASAAPSSPIPYRTPSLTPRLPPTSPSDATAALTPAGTGDDRARADAWVDQLTTTLEGTSKELAGAYLALQTTNQKIPESSIRLRSAQNAERLAAQANDAAAARLAVAQAQQARASQQNRAAAAALAAAQAKLDSYAADIFQNGGGTQLSVALGAISVDDFATRIILADTVTSLSASTISDLRTAKAENAAQKTYLTSVSTEIATLKSQAQNTLYAAGTARVAAAQAQSDLKALQVRQAAYTTIVAARKKTELGKLKAAEAEQAQLQALLAQRAARARAAAAKAAAAATASAARRRSTSVSPPSPPPPSPPPPSTGKPAPRPSRFLSYPANGPITSEYGLRLHPILRIWKLHTGTDFGVPCNTPIYAAAAGVVLSAGWGGGDGNRIVIDHGIISGTNLATTYNHLNTIIATSGRVSRGQLIGYAGTTGYSTGCHLHFETLENGNFVNPRKWI